MNIPTSGSEVNWNKVLIKNMNKLRKQLSQMHDVNEVILKSQRMKNPRSNRGSRFRGVSKHGDCYQMMIMVQGIKQYVGKLRREEDSARLYDRHAILSQGLTVSLLTSGPDEFQLLSSRCLTYY